MGAWVKRILIAASGEHEGQVFTLGPRTIIGRGGDTDIQLLDGQVSRHHALLVPAEGDGLVVSDLSSANGTWVGEESVRQITLEPGQEVRIGVSVFRYDERPANSVPPSDPVLKVLGGRTEESTFRSHLDESELELLKQNPEEFRRFLEGTMPANAERQTHTPADVDTRVTDVPGCLDPLHAQAVELGWKFCPACGGPAHDPSSSD